MEQLFQNKKIPYCCVPLTGKTAEELYDQLDVILQKNPDIIEWRADFLTDIADTELVLKLVNDFKQKTDVPLLFTIRSHKEGGENIPLSESEKIALIEAVCEQTNVDLVDYETENDTADVKRLVESAHKHGKKIILSYHNFNKTPSNEDIIKIALKAEMYGGHIAKFAVMPESKDDVLRLLEVTRTIDKMLDIPVVTMSMGDIGALSRIIGWAYGSIITFGVGVELSAPGQIPVETLREVIKGSQHLVPSWK